MGLTQAGASNYTEMLTPIMPINLMGDKAKFDDFVGVWENFVPDSLCMDIIDFWGKVRSEAVSLRAERDLKPLSFIDEVPGGMSGTSQFPGRELGRLDNSVMLETINNELAYKINQYLQSCLNHYCTQYGSLANTPLASWNCKFQETPAGGGYHVYHYESGNFNESQRCLVWMIYLNEEFEGGETEFLYQKRRIKPTTGTVVIWPAGFTHTHRGNLVLDGTKYVTTGWFYQQPV